MNINGNHKIIKSSNTFESFSQLSTNQHEPMEIDSEENNNETNKKQVRFHRMRRAHSLSDLGIVKMLKICNRFKFKRRFKQYSHSITPMSTINQKNIMKQDTLELFCKSFEELTITTDKFLDGHPNSSPHLVNMHSHTNVDDSNTITIS